LKRERYLERKKDSQRFEKELETAIFKVDSQSLLAIAAGIVE
jgi:hypothetical protein